jgi:peptide deformylase
MAIKEVLQLGNHKLRESSKKVKKFDNDFINMLKDLKDTLEFLQQTRKIGRALAAPQIGYLKNIIWYSIPEGAFTMVNPKIIWKSEETIEVWDSCYSFNVAFFIKIQRYKNIKVKYQDEEGNEKIEEYVDDMAELVQHEIDHLYGTLVTDHLKDMNKIVMRSEWEKRFK